MDNISRVFIDKTVKHWCDSDGHCTERGVTRRKAKEEKEGKEIVCWKDKWIR